jgi:hypothetical protein
MDEEYCFTLRGRSYWLVSEDQALMLRESVAHLQRVDVHEARSLVRAELLENPQRLRAHLEGCFSGLVAGLGRDTPHSMWEAYIDTKLLDDWMPSHGLYERAWSTTQVRVPVQAPVAAWTPQPTDWIEVAFVDQDGEPVPNVAYETELADGRVVRGTTGKTGAFRADGPPGNARVTFRPNAGGEGGAQLASFPGMHQVRQGQDMVSIAWAYGRNDWEAIWDEPNNRALRDACPDPMVLMPGAQVFIPPDERSPESLAMNQRHELAIEVPTIRLRVRLQHEGRNLSEAAFELTTDNSSAAGFADASGLIDEDIPITSLSVNLIVRPTATSVEQGAPIEMAYELGVGTLDPWSVRGAYQRLRNRGYCRTVSSDEGPDMPKLVCLLQFENELEETGNIESVRDVLESA